MAIEEASQGLQALNRNTFIFNVCKIIGCVISLRYVMILQTFLISRVILRRSGMQGQELTLIRRNNETLFSLKLLDARDRCAPERPFQRLGRTMKDVVTQWQNQLSDRLHVLGIYFGFWFNSALGILTVAFILPKIAFYAFVSLLGISQVRRCISLTLILLEGIDTGGDSPSHYVNLPSEYIRNKQKGNCLSHERATMRRALSRKRIWTTHGYGSFDVE